MISRAPWTAAAIAAILLFGCAKEPPPPPEHPALQYRFKRYLTGLRFSPDATRILHAIEEPTGDSLVSIALADGTSEVVAKTGPGELRNFSYFPTRPMILWAMGPKTRDMTHQFVRGVDGAITDLTPGDNVHTAFYGWSDDGGAFYFGSNKTDKRFLYLYAMDANTLKADLALQTQDTHFLAASPDRRHIVMIKPLPGIGAEMFNYDFEGRKLTRLSPPGAGYLEIGQYFTPDSSAVVYLSDAETGLLHLRKRALGASEPERLFPDATTQNVLYARRSLRGKYVVLGVAEGAVAKPLVLNGADGSPVPLKGFDGLNWDILDISKDERLMAYVNLNGASGNLSLYDFETGEHRSLRP